MDRLMQWGDAAEAVARRWGVTALRMVLAGLFLWFAMLRALAGSMSQFAAMTMDELTGGVVPEIVLLGVLAVVETTIGLGLLLWWWPRSTAVLMVVHSVGSVLTVVVLPQIAWAGPGHPTMVGQSALKDLVVIAAAAVLLSSVSSPNLASADR